MASTLPGSIAALYFKLNLRIRGGDFAGARRDLLRFTEGRKIAREEAPWLAELYRRSGAPDRAARLLFRFVYPSAMEASQVRATDHELAEYAGALIRLYAIREAERVLERMPDGDSRKWNFKAFARVHEWDYPKALECFERFEKLTPATAYAALVAQVNQADCWVETGQFERAFVALEKCVKQARKMRARLLEANCLELHAKNLVYSGQFKKAVAAIQRARSALSVGASGAADSFFLERLEHMQAIREGQVGALNAAAEFQVRARNAGQFEVARDMELQLASAHGDPNRFHAVYFGTPFRAYRQKIKALADSQGIPIGSSYARVLESGDSSKSQAAQMLVISASHFRSGGVLERLFLALNADFYRPRRLLELHEAVFVGSAFNPTSSRNQMHQAFKRLRLEFQHQKIPLGIVENRESYALHAHRPVAIELHRQTDPHRSYRMQLKDAPGASFSSKEAAALWGVSKNTAIARLQAMIARGEVQASGAARARRHVLRLKQGPIK